MCYVIRKMRPQEVDAALALGFVPQGEERQEDGIRYTPMKYVIDQQRSV